MKRRKVNVPNIITLSRIGFAILTLGLLELKNFYTTLAAIFIIIFVIFLDFLDGFIARKFGMTTELGAVLDITGDRIVEYLFWLYFSVVKIISFWFPVIVIVRGVMVDTLRNVAFSKGKKPYEIQRRKVAKFLVESPYMRTSYAIMKAVTFSLMGLDLFVKRQVPNFSFASSLHTVVLIFAVLTVLQSIARAIPVLVEASRELF